MKARVLKVLMWKHTVVRIRRFINTTIDYFSPLMFFILLYFIKKKIAPTVGVMRGVENAVSEMDVLSLREHLSPPFRLLYYPDTALTQSLMDDVGPKLDLVRLDHFPDETESGFYPYANESQITEIIPNMRKSDAVIMFRDMSMESWPERLNYTIRMKTPFKIESYKPLDPKPGPHKMFGSIYGTFMRIQWAIDTSYIKLLTGNEVPQTLSLQEFPYYHTEPNTAIGQMFLIVEKISLISLLLTYVFLVCRLLQERASGIQELMKMVGVSLNTLGVSHFLNVLPCGLVYSIGATILMNISADPLLRYTNWFIVFLLMLLHFNATMSLAFVASYISRSTQYSTTLAVMTYVICLVPLIMLTTYEDSHVPYGLNMLTGLLPHRPLHWFWNEIATLEAYGKRATFWNMMKANVYNNGSVIICYIFLLLQSAIFYSLAWYLSLTRPGQYGQALPWDFLFKRNPKTKKTYKDAMVGDYVLTEKDSDIVSPYHNRLFEPIYEIRRFCRKAGKNNATMTFRGGDGNVEYWRKNKNEVMPDSDIEEEDPIVQDPRFFESAPSQAEVGIKVINVSKMYGPNQVLRNVSLEAYKGEITVLLGHNGAGKTTLMSIITGMTSATEGKVYVNGKDTVSQQDEVRQNIGLCPQQNLFFPDLTLNEQIKFFSLLKRGTFAEANQTSRALAEQLFLKDKLHSLISQLSGGMKRRAQVACALAGGSSVLILDEPTSGLDVESRRELWDLLLSLRGDRTVLLTTHFMEEADALGDRVAALHVGVLRCYATTMHLKKAFGTGYRLSFTTIGAPKETLITNVITTHVPDATIREKTVTSISYSLPAAASKKFPKLFTVLESMRTTLGIGSIGVGVSTLEEVFLQLCSDVDTLGVDELDNIPEQELQVKKLTGILLYMNQMKILMIRQFHYASYKWVMFLILQVFLPLILILVLTRGFNNVDEPSANTLPMDLDVYRDRSDRRVLHNVSAADVTPGAVTQQYPRVAFSDTRDVAADVLRIGKEDVLEYNKYLVGVELNETDAKILYTTTVRHAAPVALNLLSNMLATRYISWADGHTINTVNEPIQIKELEQLEEKPKELAWLISWGMFITFIILATNINNIYLPCKERETRSRHIHIMSGCPAEVHWLTTLIFHMTLCTVALIIPTVFAAAVFEEDSTVNQPDFLAVFTLVLILGSLSFMAFMYLITFNHGERTASIILVAIIMVFGLITPLMSQAEDAFEESNFDMLSLTLVLCECLVPAHTMMMTVLRCLLVARDNAWCRLLRHLCPALPVALKAFDVDKCCAGGNPRCYFCIKDRADPGQGMLIMLVQFIVFMTMVILTERGFFNGLTDKIMNFRYRPAMTPDPDEMVRAEKEYVNKAITLPVKQIPDAMLVDHLHKNYVHMCKDNCNALKGVSFSVKKGECFGLLGVNGAGKSTTFKMLTAEECATRGNIFGNGYHLKRGNSQYLQTLGYCPQFFGLDMFLTGEQNLRLILILRGYNQQVVKEEVNKWIQITGLQKYANRTVSKYSGGCIRRLGAAAALCGRASVALLDEPTAGVDVAARRKLWTAVRVALRHQRSIIITSHSMDEMEALCSRIAIMARGRVRAIDTAAGLRAAHAQGHAVVFKLRHLRPADEVDSAKPLLNILKAKVQERFDCSLKDEHKTMLHYHINDEMRYSQLFSELETLRHEFQHFIEDYSVTETTLEEVFLAFAKEQPSATQIA